MKHACDVIPDGDAHRRLLDMLAGWRDYVMKCSDADPGANPPEPTPETYLGEVDQIMALYEESARASCPTEATLRVLLDRVMVMVMTGGSQAGGDGHG